MKCVNLLIRSFVMVCILLLVLMCFNSKVKANNRDVSADDGTIHTMMLYNTAYNYQSDEEDHTARDVIVAIVFLILFSVVLKAMTSDDAGTIVDNIMDWWDKLGEKINGFTKPKSRITYCPHCGEILEGDEKFCVKCGGKISKD